ncbi:MAG: FAD:protein FMN transferase [Proteobacteria bacterium]|jgi:FAD:protein FMN transferase|nr:FAD:protein FMN transferase [Pseudomonadota bacterium]
MSDNFSGWLPFARVMNIKMRVGVKQATWIFIVAFLSGAVACSEQAVSVYSGETMGTYYRVSYFGDTDHSQDIEAILTSVNNSMSTWLPDSELSRFNAIPYGTAVSLSPDLCEVVSFGLELFVLSEGAYDISIGQLVADSGFGPTSKVIESVDQDEMPDAAPFEAAVPLLMHNCELTRLTVSAMLDLSSIAKGFAVDKLARFLESHGIGSYLVEIGGELRAGNSKPDGTPWRIAIEIPDIEGGVQHVIELTNIAIATSGDYRNFLEVDGRVESHLMDPISGRSVRSEITSLSVLNISAMQADAWATALFVMGPAHAMSAAHTAKMPVYMLLRSEQNDDPETADSPGELAAIEVIANSFWRDHFD